MSQHPLHRGHAVRGLNMLLIPSKKLIYYRNIFHIHIYGNTYIFLAHDDLKQNLLGMQKYEEIEHVFS